MNNQFPLFSESRLFPEQRKRDGRKKVRTKVQEGKAEEGKLKVKKDTLGEDRTPIF